MSKFDFSKTYANKKGLVAALRKAEVDLETVNVGPVDDRWQAALKPVAKPVTKLAVPAKAPATPKAAKVTMPTQNGIRAPRADGLCGKAWAMFDTLHKAGAFDVKAALAEGAVRDLNDNNIRTELCRWRKFHGIAARVAK